MKALLLAAGLGTRLRPLTFHQAKATLPLLNVPFIRYPLQYLYANSVTGVVINLHSHPESVRRVAGGEYNGMKLEYSHEPEILGTAGAIGKAAPLLGSEPFAVLNGDMLLDAPLTAVLEQHLQTDADVTLVIAPMERFPHYGGLLFDDTQTPLRLTGFQQGEGRRYHYCGVQIVNPRIVSMIPADRKTDIFRDIYPRLLEQNARLFGYLYEGLWLEVGALREYLNTSLTLQTQPLPGHLQPPGMNGLISPGAILEPEARVTDSIVMENAVIRSGLSVDRSIIGSNVIVRKNVRGVALARGILPWYIR